MEIVYVVTCSVTNERYVGRTASALAPAWRKLKFNLRNGKGPALLQAVHDKHGVDTLRIKCDMKAPREIDAEEWRHKLEMYDPALNEGYTQYVPKPDLPPKPDPAIPLEQQLEEAEAVLRGWDEDALGSPGEPMHRVHMLWEAIMLRDEPDCDPEDPPLAEQLANLLTLIANWDVELDGEVEPDLLDMVANLRTRIAAGET